MSTVEEIENAIRKLTRGEFFRMRNFMRALYENVRDREIAEDAEAGRLDEFAEQALAEYKNGLTTEFPPNEQPRNP